MTDGSAERANGRVEGKLEVLSKMVEQGQEDGREGRARIYQELELIRADAASTRHQVSGLKDRLDEAAPTIADIRRWKERFLGMQMLAAAIFAVIGGSAVLLWKWIAAKLGI